MTMMTRMNQRLSDPASRRETDPEKPTWCGRGAARFGLAVCLALTGCSTSDVDGGGVDAFAEVEPGDEDAVMDGPSYGDACGGSSSTGAAFCPDADVWPDRDDAPDPEDDDDAWEDDDAGEPGADHDTWEPGADGDTPAPTEDTLLDDAVMLDAAGPGEDTPAPDDATDLDVGPLEDAASPEDTVAVSPVLSVTLEGSGAGQVWSTPPGIDCPGTCEAAFPLGSAVTLHALPSGDSVLQGWDGLCGDSGTCELAMDGDLDLGVIFEQALVSVWTLHGQGPNDVVWVNRVAAYDDGGLAIAGGYSGTVDFGDGPVASAGGGVDVFVARYGPDDALMWLWTFGDEEVEDYTSDDGVMDLAADSAGNVIVVGTFAHTVDFGDGPVTVPEAEETVVPQGAFVAKLARLDGAVQWSWTAPLGVVRSAAVTPDDEVVVAGGFSGAATWGDVEHVASGKRDVFMAKHSADGEVLWARTYGDEAPTGIDFEGASAVRLAPNGDVVLAGFYDGTIDLGGESHTAVLDNFGIGLSTDIFIARYTATGQLLWSRSVGGPGIFNAPKSVYVTPDGRVLATGWWSQLIDFGDEVIASGLDPSEIDIWIARWDADGALEWVHTTGSPGAIDRWDEIVIDETGRTFISGGFYGQMPLGETLESTGGMDALLVEIDAEGEALWSHQVCKSPADDLAPTLAVAGQDQLLLGGWFKGTADFGEGPVEAVGNTAAYVMRRLK